MELINYSGLLKCIMVMGGIGRAPSDMHYLAMGSTLDHMQLAHTLHDESARNREFFDFTKHNIITTFKTGAAVCYELFYSEIYQVYVPSQCTQLCTEHAWLWKGTQHTIRWGIQGVIEHLVVYKHKGRDCECSLRMD